MPKISSKKRGFAKINRCVFKDASLSLKARGLLCTMIQLPDSWDFSFAGLAQLCKDSPESVSSAAKELEEKGYLVRVRDRDGGGKLKKWIFYIFEDPADKDAYFAGSPHRQNPDVVKPDLENPDLANPDLEKPGQFIPNQFKPKEFKPNEYMRTVTHPHLDEVSSYIQMSCPHVLPADFYNGCEAKGWDTITDWKKYADGWERKAKEGGFKTSGNNSIQNTEEDPDSWYNDRTFQGTKPEDEARIAELLAQLDAINEEGEIQA